MKNVNMYSLLSVLSVIGLIGCQSELDIQDRDSENTANTEESDFEPIADHADEPVNEEPPTVAPEEDDSDNRPEEEPPASNENQCGNGIIEDGETCDSDNLGEFQCRTAGFAGGQASCDASCRSFLTQDCVDLAANPIAPAGQSITLSGSLVQGDPLWHRPAANCELQEEGQYLFDAYAIVNHTDRPQELRIISTWGEQDGYLHVFSSPWNPMTNEGCIAGNDDAATINASEVPSLIVPAGHRMVLALSTYEAEATIENYELQIETILKTEEPPTGDDIPSDPPIDDNLDDDETTPESVCGNNKIEPGEVCDGSDLGDTSCAEMGYAFGVVICSDSCSSYFSFCFGEGDPDVDDNTPPPVDVEPATSIPAPGLNLTLTGSLNESNDTWQRVNEDCTAANGTDYYVEAHRIINDSSEARTISVKGNWPTDGYLAIYDDASYGNVPGAGCLAADDDFANSDIASARQLGSQIKDFALAPGQIVTLIASTYSEATTMDNYALEVTTSEPGAALPIATIEEAGRSITSQGLLHETDATWHRIEEECASTEKEGDYFFDPTYVKNTSGETQEIEVVANWQNGDGYLHVFLLDESNQPTLTGLCLGGNDDSLGASQSKVAGSMLTMFTDEVFVIVASTYTAGATISAYDLDIITR
jgi:hypothetical protein